MHMRAHTYVYISTRHTNQNKHVNTPQNIETWKRTSKRRNTWWAKGHYPYPPATQGSLLSVRSYCCRYLYCICLGLKRWYRYHCSLIAPLLPVQRGCSQVWTGRNFCIWVYKCMYVHVFVYLCLYVCMYERMCICVWNKQKFGWLSRSFGTCMYICIYVYIHAYFQAMCIHAFIYHTYRS
jgi:hypothetical protein